MAGMNWSDWRSFAQMNKHNAKPWWTGETAIRVSDIPNHVPRLPSGRKVSVASAYRWTLAGLDGVRLRRFKVGGSWCTTLEELVRWQDALTTIAGECD